MGDSVSFRIAGLNLAVDSPLPISLHGISPGYRQFVRKASRDRAATDIQVRLELGGISDTEGLAKVFDGGQAWSLFQSGDVYYLICHPPVLEQPQWVARFGRDCRNVTVYCSEALIRTRDGTTSVSNPFHYPLDMLLLMYALAPKGGAIIHAAGASIGGKGFVFAGQSSAGKTTISRLLVGQDGFELLSDDRMVVRKIDSQFRAFGSPWPGDAGIALNKSAPLAGLLFLQHGAADRIAEMGRQEALERLLPVASIPWYDREIVPRMLHFCEDLVSHVPCFELHFKPDGEVVHLLRGLAAV